MSHTTSPMEAARRQWWDGLSKEGDPSRIVNPLSSGFRAGWEAAGSINAELLEALKAFVNIPDPQNVRDWTERFDIALALIAKATGGAA